MRILLFQVPRLYKPILRQQPEWRRREWRRKEWRMREWRRREIFYFLNRVRVSFKQLLEHPTNPFKTPLLVLILARPNIFYLNTTFFFLILSCLALCCSLPLPTPYSAKATAIHHFDKSSLFFYSFVSLPSFSLFLYFVSIHLPL